jgi:cell division septum initiation protein DivIVA
MVRMSHGGDLFALGEGVASEPSFDTALRGYDKRQVDKYVASVENDLTTVSAERDQAYLNLQALAGQVQQLQDQLVEAARKAAPSRVSFRHLGSRVEQILTLAEDQAETIVSEAEQSILDRRAEADRILADAQHRASTAAKDFELALAARRAEERKADEQQRTALEQETHRLRAEARDLLNHAQQEAQALRTAAAQEIAGRRVQADKDIAQARADFEQQLVAAEREIAAAVERAQTQRAAVAAVESQLAAVRAEAATAQEQLATLRLQVAAEAGQLEQLRHAAQQAAGAAPGSPAGGQPAVTPVLPMAPDVVIEPPTTVLTVASPAPEAAAAVPDSTWAAPEAASEPAEPPAPTHQDPADYASAASTSVTSTSADDTVTVRQPQAAGPLAESGASGIGPGDSEPTMRLSMAAMQDEATQTIRLDAASRDGAQRYAAPRDAQAGSAVPSQPADDEKTTELRAG